MSSMPFALDPYRPADSFLHRLDARIKLVLTLSFILVSALLPVGAWPAYVLLAALVWSWALLSSLGIVFSPTCIDRDPVCYWQPALAVLHWPVRWYGLSVCVVSISQSVWQVLNAC